MNVDKLRGCLHQLIDKALQAVDPEEAVTRYLRKSDLPVQSYRKVFLIGFGKAAVPMALALEKELGDKLQQGMVVVKDGHGGSLSRTRVFEASHPEPDERGEAATKQILAFLMEHLTPEDLLFVVVSGGGSALFPAAAPGLTLEDKKKVTHQLIRCGATIHEINGIRKHISRVKGGRLLEFTNHCTVRTLILSDVVGDDISSIASGPTAPDPTTFADCLSVIDRYEIASLLPPNVVSYLQRGRKGGAEAPAETPKPGDARFERVQNIIVGSNFLALGAAAREAARQGLEPLILSSSMYGNTADVARVHVAMAREVLRSGNPVARPCCLISGGETTVQVKGEGKGGRNAEFVLWCAHETRDWSECDVLFASIGSDGNDGPTDAAGAVATPRSVARASARNLESAEYLKRNDSYHFFEALGDLVITGPTRTNVMDLRFVLIA